MPPLTPRLVLSGCLYSSERVRGGKAIDQDPGQSRGADGKEQGTGRMNRSLLVLLWPANSTPLALQFYGRATTTPLPGPPPWELLLPQYIPEMHSRRVGQLGRGGNGGQEVKS